MAKIVVISDISSQGELQQVLNKVLPAENGCPLARGGRGMVEVAVGGIGDLPDFIKEALRQAAENARKQNDKGGK